MKIAIYYPWIYLTSGIERTILEILNIPGHQFTIFTNHFDSQHTFPEFKNIQIIQLKKVPVERNLLAVLKASLIIIFQKINLAGFDLLFIQSEGLGDLIALRNHQIPIVTLCQTPLRPVFDPYYRRHVLSNKPIFYRFLFAIFSHIFKIVDRLAYQKFNHIIFNSQETKSRAIKGGLIKKSAKNISIAHPGINWSSIKPTKNFESYFLLPGRIMWTKQIELAIQSFILFKKNFPQHKKFRLIIAGQIDKKSRAYYQELKQKIFGRSDIKFIKNPSDAKLFELYRNCYAVISCAFNEDWGITLIEGNAYSKPTIAINRGGPIQSQINNKTGLLVKGTATEFARAYNRLADNPSLTKKMGMQARHHAKQYDWSQFRQVVNSVIMKSKEKILSYNDFNSKTVLP